MFNVRTFYECIMYKSATEAINAFASGILLHLWSNVSKIVLSTLEHHSNLVPWLKYFVNNTIIVISANRYHIPNVREFIRFVDVNTKLISLTHMSNVFGCLVPIKNYVNICSYQTLSLVDGTQAVSHFKVNVMKLGCSCYVFTSHKWYAPVGAGISLIKKTVLDFFLPHIYGGGATFHVKPNTKIIDYYSSPKKFEAGSFSSFSLICFSLVMYWIKKYNVNYERHLLRYMYKNVLLFNCIGFLNNWFPSSRIIVFKVNHVFADDLASILNNAHVCVRAGTQCATPLLDSIGISSLCRVSIGMYNLFKEADMLLFTLGYVCNSNSSLF